MAETFFGPWRIVVIEELGPPWPWEFVISGSDNADGVYVAEQLDPMGIAVTGVEWTIELVMLPNFLIKPTRATQFVVPDGLTVHLISVPIGIGVRRYFLLRCISMDPEVHPIPTPNPFDFTIPGG